jgi:CheY-like chemotaxis protein
MDDDASVARVLRRMLRRLGYTAVTVPDGLKLLDAWSSARAAGTPFAAAIMDLTIPGGMGGKEAIRQLREIDPEARCIVSSGYANDPILAEWREHGFAGVLPKPYQQGDVLSVLERVLGPATSG